MNNSQLINTKRLDFSSSFFFSPFFFFLESCNLARDRSYWLCGKLCEGMVSVQVCVPVSHAGFIGVEERGAT